MEENTGAEFLAGLIGLTILAVFYFIPSIVGRKKKDSTAIIVVNLFLGWTVIGWIVALAWAIRHDPPGSDSHRSVHVNVHNVNKEE